MCILCHLLPLCFRLHFCRNSSMNLLVPLLGCHILSTLVGLVSFQLSKLTQVQVYVSQHLQKPKLVYLKQKGIQSREFEPNFHKNTAQRSNGIIFSYKKLRGEKDHGKPALSIPVFVHKDRQDSEQSRTTLIIKLSTKSTST